MDVNLMLDEDKIKDWLEFDRVNQVVKIKPDLPSNHPLGGNNSNYLFAISVFSFVQRRKEQL